MARAGEVLDDPLTGGGAGTDLAGEPRLGKLGAAPPDGGVMGA